MRSRLYGAVRGRLSNGSLYSIRALNEKKSILEDEKWREEWNKYKTKYYNKDVLQNFNLDYEETTGEIF